MNEDELFPEVPRGLITRDMGIFLDWVDKEATVATTEHGWVMIGELEVDEPNGYLDWHWEE